MVSRMRVLFIGEIVGKSGVFTVKNVLPGLVQEKEIDFVVANANGATGGFGMGKNHSIYLRKRGIGVMTSGECVYYKKDMVTHIAKAPYLLRPANFPPGVPGRGWGVFDTPKGPLGSVNMIGQSGYPRLHGNNPFTYIPEVVKKIKERTPRILFNFHATATAEKMTMGHHVDGKVSAMMGTGTRVLTADAGIFPKGTAYITDTGRTGSHEGVRGLETETELRILLTRVPERSREAWGTLKLQGVIIDIGENGKAEGVEIVDAPCEEEPHDANGDGRPG